ncbi:hypothetical protein AAFF_G00059480 [Aldrovandia affinis]|uniref:Uncharacterized protein n=1 Tax=Aldrovandia affinis TaxID=143900 RepID=A0AAD7S012_9TELE|nr:hypothetical protein AAFF_G00059480 [Aldrovandia affinis]
MQCLSFILMFSLWSATSGWYDYDYSATTEPNWAAASSPQPDWMTTAQPFWGRQTQRSYRWRPTPQPYWKRQTQRPYWWRPTQRSYRWRPTAEPYWKRQTQRPYRWRPTAEPYWKRQTLRPYWSRWRPTAEPYWMTPTAQPYWNRPSVPKPRIQVYVEADRSESFQVTCLYQLELDGSHFQLDVVGRDTYTARNPGCTSGAVCRFNVTASPPVSFTCVHRVRASGMAVALTSDTFTASSQDKCSSTVSPMYIAFFVIIMLGLATMTVVVVVTIRKTRQKGLFGDSKYNGYKEKALI